jgi:predicted PolB exonuclease-like 3'-5' exonuclease
MKHKIEASWLYKSGDKCSSARVKMNELCAVFGLPGKIGVDGSKVEAMFYNRQLQEIRNYCETDVLNSYLLYLVFQHHSGNISLQHFEESKLQIINFLQENQDKLHLKEFLSLLK